MQAEQQVPARLSCRSSLDSRGLDQQLYSRSRLKSVMIAYSTLRSPLRIGIGFAKLSTEDHTQYEGIPECPLWLRTARCGRVVGETGPNPFVRPRRVLV